MHYIVVDLHNMMHRAKHVTRGDAYLKAGMAIHVTLCSIRAAMKKFEDAEHVVFCSDGRSWRKDYYPQYKANRAKIRISKSRDEEEEERIFFDTVKDLESFIEDKSNCVLLHDDNLEADDLIAGFVDSFDDGRNKFTIISTDTDFQQLVNDNVQLYDGVQGKLTTVDGIFDDKGKPFKGKEEKPDPEYMLFEKCIRGDKSDNIESAYPGCRKKGTKNKIGILEAFDDRHNRGYDWNNFMKQTWTDFDSNTHTVEECYERNKMLIDLHKQPDEIKNRIKSVINEKTSSPKDVRNVGIHFLKFCKTHELNNLQDNPDVFVKFLNNKLRKQ